jgi:hypothetical protein
MGLPSEELISSSFSSGNQDSGNSKAANISSSDLTELFKSLGVCFFWRFSFILLSETNCERN